MKSPILEKSVIGGAICASLPRLLGAHGKQRLSILIYHRVLEAADELAPGNPTAADFEWQMQLLANFFHPLSLDDALTHLDKGTLPERAVCVTFDDGYQDNAAIALPILKRWDVPATVFVASGYLNGGRMWNDTVLEAIRTLDGKSLDLNPLGLGKFELSSADLKRRAATKILTSIKHLPGTERQEAVNLIGEAAAGPLPDNLMMTDAQVKDLAAAGVEIGGHTVSHPILATLDNNAAQQEICENKQYLERLTERRLRFFAYPNGRLGSDYRAEQCQLVRDAGYEAAFSTHAGVSSAATDRWQLPRFTPWDRSPGRFLIRLLINSRQLVVSPSSTGQ